MARGTSHGLGMGKGSLIEHEDGSVEYRQTGKMMPAFRVDVRDIAGFSVRKATRDDKKRLDASSMQQVLTIQGSGTVLAEVAVNYGTAEKIESWLRAHPDFGAGRGERSVARPTAAPPSGPPAGWYQDPDGVPGNRWWDGTAWTEHRQQPGPPPPSPR